MKNPHIKCLEIRGVPSQLKVPCKPRENSLLSSLSLLVKRFEVEIQPSGDRVDITRGQTLE